MAQVNRSDAPNTLDALQRARNTQATNRSNQPGAGSNVNAPPVGGEGDRVVLSDDFNAILNEVARLQQELEQLPDARQEVVEELRQEVQNGTFVVDNRAVADKVMAESAPAAGMNPNNR
jgi:flagellar biosynthesis anti-sigma factor FlgM